MNDQFVLTAQVADVVSGRTDGTASVRGRYPADFLDSVDDLCLKLLHHLTPSPGPGAAGFRPARLATQSVEASRHYVEALSWQALGGRRGCGGGRARSSTRRWPSIPRSPRRT